ncbi:MAG: hypothetical protein LC120_04910 [Bacteroidales bacterium]|jgi:hypothetical protein|nr:hypothetical protein [Bacteroidales bacterium]
MNFALSRVVVLLFFALSARTIARIDCQSLPLVGFVTLAPNGSGIAEGGEL